MDSSAWDARYAGADLVWGADPNRFVAEALDDEPPGRALDVACGEGRNAIWLATRGWHATGVDFSRAGVDRARSLADAAGVADRTDFAVVDVVHDRLPPGPYDAVVLAYLQVPAAERRTVLRSAASVLAPGGLLVIVAHDSSNLTDGYAGPQDAAVLYTPEDITADLADVAGLETERAERVVRRVETPEGDRNAIDALFVARLRSAGPAESAPDTP